MTDIPNWEVNSQGKLERTFIFKNFDEALNFFNACADLAQKADHHPDLYLHDWKKLTITLFTHSEEAITDKDYTLAQQINQLPGHES